MPFSDHKEFFVSWEDLHRDSRLLARRQMPASQWKGIIAVSRGGLVPAAILARELGIRMVDTICVSSYDHQQQRELTIIKHAISENDGEGFLIVDDLVDTGVTARAIRELFPKARFVTLYAKPQGRELVDEYVADVEQETWIQLPWDMQLNYVAPIAERDLK